MAVGVLFLVVAKDRFNVGNCGNTGDGSRRFGGRRFEIFGEVFGDGGFCVLAHPYILFREVLIGEGDGVFVGVMRAGLAA